MTWPKHFVSNRCGGSHRIAVCYPDPEKLFKLVWNAVGSEFTSRHTQYEMSSAGAMFMARGHAFRTCAWEAATGLVDRFLASYDLLQAPSPYRSA